MKPKKNPKADLSRKTGLFFAIGLAIATSLSLFAITLETSVGNSAEAEKKKTDDKLDEDVEEVVMNQNTPPPPPPPPAPEVPEEIKQVDNTVETKTMDFTTEDDKNTKVEPAPDLTNTSDDEPTDDIVVPFSVIEDKPMFEACKSLPKAQQDDCFKKQLDTHVQKNFKYPEMAAEMGIQGRVFVQFKIEKDGKVNVVGVRGPDKSLEAEARRIIEKMPRLEPGKQRGKPVAVTYSYPIMFKLN